MSEWYRQRGEVLIALGESEEGEMVLRAGLGLADQQAAPTLALRCALPLARALSDRGELGAARVLVEPILLSLNEAAGTLEYDEAMRL